MTNDTLTQQLYAIAEPLAASLSLTLWGIDVSFGGRNLICVYVEGENGVSIGQCADLSRLIGLTLEVEDIVPTAYVLEVSSPGVERKFFTAKQLAGAVGNKIEVTLLHPKSDFPGRRKFRGMLADRKGKVFYMMVEDCARPGEETPVLDFTFDEVKKAKQVHFIPEKVLPGKGAKKKPKTAAEQAEAAQHAAADPLAVELRPLTPEEQELLSITGGCEAL